MELKVDRKYKKGTYTISNLFIDGDWVCNIIEDKDRGLHKGMSLADGLSWAAVKEIISYAAYKGGSSTALIQPIKEVLKKKVIIRK